MWKNLLVGVSLVVLAGAAVWQAKTIRELRQQQPLAVQSSPLPTATAEEPTPRAVVSRDREPRRAAAAEDAALEQRIVALEKQVTELIEASEYLMVRGQLPLAEHKRAEFEQTFLNVSASDRDRLQALRLLRRNGGTLSDTLLQQALSWLNTSTNRSVREDLVRQMQGLTNGPVRDPLMKIAAADADEDVRREAVQSLRRLVTDPQVEALMWELALKDGDRRIREEAEESLREGPMTDARRAALKQRAMDANSSLDERLIAMRALREAGEGASEAAAALAQFVQATQNPEERARVFDAFDGANDPTMKLPLVYGLQDADATVRARAADALSGYADPAVVEWLNYIAQNDPDQRVRREAEQAAREASGRVARAQAGATQQRSRGERN